jgi:hypothetical protein
MPKRDIYGDGQIIATAILNYCKKNNIDIDEFYKDIKEYPYFFIDGIADGIGAHRNDSNRMYNRNIEYHFKLEDT